MLIARFHTSVRPSNSLFALLLRRDSFPWCASLPYKIWQVQKTQKKPVSGRGNLHSTIAGPNYIQKSKMAGLKRKEVPTSTVSKARDHKKFKNEASQSKKALRAAPILETETDSDPIVESDTAEQSGDDDGVSWPSDDELAAQNSSVQEEGGVKISHSASKGGVNASTSAKQASNGTISFPEIEDKFDKLAIGSSKEAHAKQKVVALERKAAKPNADVIARSKKLWERLRRKSHVPLAERKELVAELFEIVTGRVKDFVFKHDSVRVVQTALKYANIDQRKMIARELRGEYKGLAESRYAKFLIGKLLVHGDDEIRDMVVPEFYGHVRRMIKHPEASWILDDVYRGIATPTQKAKLLREWYGAEFAIFKMEGPSSTSADLKEMLGKHPEKRTPMMRSLHELINQLVQKKTTGFTILHDAMLQYFLNVQPGSEEATDFMELLKGDEEGDLLKNLAFTQPGSRVICLALSHGNAKDRKQILKTFKTLMQTLAYDSHGHQILLAAYDVIDDTVLTAKSVFPELTAKDLSFDVQTQTLLASAIDRNARIALLYLFAGKSKAILPPEDLTLLDEIHQIRLQTSKKLPETRRKELLASLSPPLLTLISYNAETLVQTSFGCQFLSEVLLSATGDRGPALRAVAALARSSPQILQTPAAGRMLKTLVVGGRFNPRTGSIDPADSPLGFHDLFWGKIQDDVLTWAVSDNSFVVVGLLEAEGFGGGEELKEVLRRGRTQLKQAAEVVAKVVEDGKGNKKEKLESGNKGAELLLSMI